MTVLLTFWYTAVNPGVCPRPSFKDIMMKGPCYEEDQDMDMCTSDEQCDGDEKCCFNGCHRTCGEKQGNMIFYMIQGFQA